METETISPIHIEEHFIPRGEFSLAKQHYDERNGQTLRQKTNWQRMALAESVALITAIGGLIYLGTLPKTSTQLLMIDKTTGSVRFGGLAHDVKMDAGTWNSVKHTAFVAFIESWRTVSSDPQLGSTYWDRTYSWIQKGSKAQLDMYHWFTAHPPTDRSHEELVSVHVDTDGPVTGNTWEVWWTEAIYKGGRETTQKWRSLFTYRVTGPTDYQQNSGFDTYNALGIYITDFSDPQLLDSTKEAQ